VDPQKRQPMSDRRRLTRCFLVRTSDPLGAAIDVAAAGENLSSASYIRRIVTSTLPPENQFPADPSQHDRQRSPRRVARPKLEPAEIELRMLTRDLGRLTGAVIQLAKSLRELGSSEHPSAEHVLAEVRAASMQAVALVERMR
jgi:hypothetical protein